MNKINELLYIVTIGVHACARAVHALNYGNV